MRYTQNHALHENDDIPQVQHTNKDCLIEKIESIPKNQPFACPFIHIVDGTAALVKNLQCVSVGNPQGNHTFL